MRAFGEFPSLSLECSSVTAAIQFACSPDQENKPTSNINELRYEIFIKKNVSWDRLPPILSRRVNYQTFIWKSAGVPILNLPSSIGNVLQIEGLRFCQKFILNSSTLDAIVELTRYKWKKGCKKSSSSCKRANLVYADLCSCNINDDCENTNYYKLCESDEEENDQLTK